MARRRRLLFGQGEEFKTLSLLFALAVIPVIGTICLIATTSSPTLELRTFGDDEGPDPTPALDWPSLERLNDGDSAALAKWSELVRRPVRVLGYMIPYNEPIDVDGKVNRFLLVPDAGHLLHPPHRFDPGEVVVVALDAAARVVKREHVAYWVTGKLNIRRTQNAAVNSGFLLEATRVEVYMPHR